MGDPSLVQGEDILLVEEVLLSYGIQEEGLLLERRQDLAFVQENLFLLYKIDIFLYKESFLL